MHHPTVSPTAAPKLTPATHTTRRGIATASFCLGLWSSLTFWWYPFGILIATVAITFALLSIIMGWRAGKDGEHLAWLGLFFGLNGATMAVLCYRFVQVAYEGIIPSLPLPL